MTPPLLVSAGLLLLALLPGPPCGALPTRGSDPGARQAPQLPRALRFLQPQPQPRAVLLRMGEGSVVRQGDLRRSPAAPPSPASPPLAGRSGGRLPRDQVAANFFRALLRRQLDSSAGPTERGRQEAPDRERRSEGPPTSLDLTFHLLRELLEIAKAEQLRQQAERNRELMESIGK